MCWNKDQISTQEHTFKSTNPTNRNCDTTQTQCAKRYVFSPRMLWVLLLTDKIWRHFYLWILAREPNPGFRDNCGTNTSYATGQYQDLIQPPWRDHSYHRILGSIPGPISRDWSISRFHHNRHVLADNPITSLVCFYAVFISVRPHLPFQMMRCPSNGSSSFLLGNPRCVGQLPSRLRYEMSNPIGGEVPRLLTPGQDSSLLCRIHTPSARTQDNDEICRYFHLWILSPCGLGPGNRTQDSMITAVLIPVTPWRLYQDLIQTPWCNNWY